MRFINHYVFIFYSCSFQISLKASQNLLYGLYGVSVVSNLYLLWQSFCMSFNLLSLSNLVFGRGTPSTLILGILGYSAEGFQASTSSMSSCKVLSSNSYFLEISSLLKLSLVVSFAHASLAWYKKNPAKAKVITMQMMTTAPKIFYSNKKKYLKCINSVGSIYWPVVLL